MTPRNPQEGSTYAIYRPPEWLPSSAVIGQRIVFIGQSSSLECNIYYSKDVDQEGTIFLSCCCPAPSPPAPWHWQDHTHHHQPADRAAGGQAGRDVPQPQQGREQEHGGAADGGQAELPLQLGGGGGREYDGGG